MSLFFIPNKTRSTFTSANIQGGENKLPHWGNLYTMAHGK